MAKCDQGYICQVCGQPVTDMRQSDLYLRYIIGRVPLQALHSEPERHLRCNPVLAQFIVDAQFPEILVEDDFAKCHMDEAQRTAEEELITRGWQRLQEAQALGLSVPEYPLAAD